MQKATNPFSVIFQEMCSNHILNGRKHFVPPLEVFQKFRDSQQIVLSQSDLKSNPNFSTHSGTTDCSPQFLPSILQIGNSLAYFLIGGSWLFLHKNDLHYQLDGLN